MILLKGLKINMRSKLYMITVFKRIEYSPNIIHAEVYDTFDIALENGKNAISDDCYNNSDIDLITENDYINYINAMKENDTEYFICISVISTDRKIFNTSKELMDYFNSNIKNISNNNLYDFLLSLVTSDDYTYDYEGNLVDHSIEVQCPALERVFSPNVEFDMESCEQGKYTFEYLYR